MPSADAHSVPLNSACSGKSGRPDVSGPLRRFFHRLFKGRSQIEALPDDLRGDLALPQAVLESRTEAFWGAKCRSSARDLPL
ncbi:hypothetical protein J2X76_001866 [Neorhizobium sp. 2083]|uniref:hypothetical protein n=1 Tax=Neorhizobium sp. 2083 TaxID=2817762 RepID=UPI0028616717|nr:hypothetical protein [Neorhizobium sp. 2083]MDR6816693.1 hypothetical protein [Neorhizobium sp. 2083]